MIKIGVFAISVMEFCHVIKIGVFEISVMEFVM